MLEIFEIIENWLKHNNYYIEHSYNIYDIYIIINSKAIIYDTDDNCVCVNNVFPPFKRIYFNINSPSFFNELEYELNIRLL